MLMSLALPLSYPGVILKAQVMPTNALKMAPGVGFGPTTWDILVNCQLIK